MDDRICISKKFVYIFLASFFLICLVYLSKQINSNKTISNSQAMSGCSRRYDYLNYSNKLVKSNTDSQGVSIDKCEYRVRSYKVSANTYYENAYTGYRCNGSQFILDNKCNPYFYGQRDLQFQKYFCYIGYLLPPGMKDYYCPSNTNNTGDAKIGSLYYGYDFQDSNAPIYQVSKNGVKQYINKHFDLSRVTKIENFNAYTATSMTYVQPTIYISPTLTPTVTVTLPKTTNTPTPTITPRPLQ